MSLNYGHSALGNQMVHEKQTRYTFKTPIDSNPDLAGSSLEHRAYGDDCDDNMRGDSRWGRCTFLVMDWLLQRTSKATLLYTIICVYVYIYICVYIYIYTHINHNNNTNNICVYSMYTTGVLRYWNFLALAIGSLAAQPDPSPLLLLLQITMIILCSSSSSSNNNL